MNTGSMSDSDARLMDQAMAWISELNAIIPPGETRPTMTYIILTGPGPTPAYALLRCKGRESPLEAPLGIHLTLQDAIEAMKRAAGSIAPEGWRFRLMCRECK